MSQKTDANHLLPPERFAGELAVDGQRIPVQLTASAGPSGRLQLAVDPISTANSFVALRTLIRSLGRPGNAIDEFALECESSDGSRLTSECAYLAGYNRNSEGLHIELRTREACLTMTAPEIRPRPALRFSLLGFACFPPVHAPAAIGSVIAQGATRTAATHEITGSIAAEAADDCPSTMWRASAEHTLKHLRSVLAFSARACSRRDWIGDLNAQGATRTAATHEITGSIAAEAADDCPSTRPMWRASAQAGVGAVRGPGSPGYGAAGQDAGRR